MTRGRIINAVAGFFIMGSVALSQSHDIRWLYFTAFVGLNLFQFSFTGFCPMVIILKKLGVKEA